MGVFSTDVIGLPKPVYEYITTDEQAREAVAIIHRQPIIEIDSETTAFNPYEGRISLIQVGIPNKSYVFDVRNDTEHSSVDPKTLKPILIGNNQIRILQHAVFDMKMIKHHYGFYIENIYDTMLTEQLFHLGKNVKANLPALVFKYLGITMDKEPANTFMDYYQKFQPFQLEYAANDVSVLRLIRDLQLPKIREHNFEDVCRLEFEFTKPMCEMELNGIEFDANKQRKLIRETEIERQKFSKQVTEILSMNEDQTTLFGVSLINLDSNLQLKKALNKYGLNLESTSVGVLEKHKGLPVIDALLAYRKAQKFISTYGETLIAQISKITGRLHTDFTQMVSTGRMSSSDPNLQNIPKKQKYRSAFIARDGYSLITADMSGAELRILGNMSQDPIFIECFRDGIDLHTRTIAEIKGIPMSEVVAEMRNAAKAINFGLCVIEDANVITNNGIKKIKHVEISETIAHDMGKDIVIDKAYMGEKEVFEIETQYGYTLEATEDHLIKVIDSDGNYIDKELKNLDLENDYVCLKMGSNVFSKNDFVFDEFSVNKRTNYKHFDLPKRITKEWSAFLGLFVSEGSISKIKNRKRYSLLQFGFSDENLEFINKIDKLFYSLFGNRLYRQHKNGKVKYSFNSVLFCEWLASICNIKNVNKTGAIYVPDCIKQSTKEIQVEFLKWLFEGDGSVKQNGSGYKISYSSKSYNLIKDLQVMLLNFGMLSSVRFEHRKKYGKEKYYELSLISNKSRELFHNHIGFLTAYKNSKCINDGKIERSVYFIPNQSKETINDVLKNGKLKEKGRRFGDIIYNIRNYTKGIGDAQLERIKDYNSFLKFIYDNKIVPLPIKSIISRGIKKVYDISVENHQYFLANGFVVHNCYGLSKFGLARRLKITEKAAEEMINKYFERYQGVKKYLNQSARDAVRNKYSMSISGRKRFYTLPDYNHPDYKRIAASVQRRGMNQPIQGCLVSDTNIKGLGCINNYVNKEIELETGFGRNRAVGVYSGEKEIYKLKLSNGSELGITLEHKIPICTSEGVFDKHVSNIELNKDLLMIPLNVEDGDVTDLFGYKYEKKHWRETYVDYPHPNEMEEKLAFIIGCLIGDGNYNRHNHFRFFCIENDSELFDKYNKCIEKLFKYKPVIDRVKKKKNILLTSQVSSVVLRGFLKHIGLDYVANRNKSVPKYFFTETLKNKGALLNGLFSTDGGITDQSGPNYTTTSKQLANNIQQLLFSLGINSNLKTYIELGSYVYRLQIGKRFNKKFNALIGFSVNRKTDLLDFNYKGDKSSLVPEFIPKVIYKVLKTKGIYNSLSINEKAHLRRFKVGSCSFYSWRKFYEYMPKCKEKEYISNFLNYDFCKAISLEKIGTEKTYDLSCVNSPNYFVANGVIVHNSNADTIKQAMIYLTDRLEESDYDARLILTVHDEVVVEVKTEQAQEVKSIVEQSLIDGFGRYFSVIPMETEGLIGDCWLKDACENKPDDKHKCGGTEMRFDSNQELRCIKCGGKI